MAKLASFYMYQKYVPPRYVKLFIKMDRKIKVLTTWYLLLNLPVPVCSEVFFLFQNECANGAYLLPLSVILPSKVGDS